MDRRDFLMSSIAAAIASSMAGRAFAAGAAVAADVPAITDAGKTIALGQAELQALRDSLRGAMLLKGDPGYDEARRVLNASINKFPAVIVQPSGVADVQTAVNFARDHDLLLAVKCGGHSYAGKSTCEGGMQVDLSHFRGVRVDPGARVAYVAGGSLLGEIDHEAMSQGLVTTAGTVSHTGVGGLTLGGGFGRLGRRFGLALDNLHGVDIVNADGRLRHASLNENPDLFWGVRGGGGNFGIVTSFEFDLHPMQRQVIGGDLVFPISRARELLDFYANYAVGAPDDLYCDAAMVAPPGGKDGVFAFDVCYSGAASDADRVLAPLRKLGKPIKDGIGPIDYVKLQRSGDRTDPRNTGSYLKSGFINDFPPKLATTLLDGFQPDPRRETVVFFQHAGGAIGRVAPDATAFPHRRAKLNMFAVATWDLDVDGAPHSAWVKEYWARLQPYTDGYYTNEVAGEAQKIVDENYQGNIGRLVELKNKYDPGNLFRLNANVKPTT